MNYHANPYDISATGFYFDSYEQFLEKAARHTNAYGQPVEEFEIQAIDAEHPALFRELSIDQASLELWFEHFEGLSELEAAKSFFLSSDRGMDAEEIQAFDLDQIYLFEGSALDYAYAYIEETGMLSQMPESLSHYFDYESFARDLLLGGDISEFEGPDGTRYIAVGSF